MDHGPAGLVVEALAASREGANPSPANDRKTAGAGLDPARHEVIRQEINKEGIEI
jgi:hypothetical protein